MNTPDVRPDFGWLARNALPDGSPLDVVMVQNALARAYNAGSEAAVSKFAARLGVKVTDTLLYANYGKPPPEEQSP